MSLSMKILLGEYIPFKRITFYNLILIIKNCFDPTKSMFDTYLNLC